MAFAGLDTFGLIKDGLNTLLNTLLKMISGIAIIARTVKHFARFEVYSCLPSVFLPAYQVF